MSSRKIFPSKGKWNSGGDAKGGGRGKQSAPALTNGNHWQASAGAIKEITSQLQTAGNDGHIWIHDWGRRYGDQLGSLRDFLLANSDKFTVRPEGGNKFSVMLANRWQPKVRPWREEGRKGGGDGWWKGGADSWKGGDKGGWGKGWDKGGWGKGSAMPALGNGGGSWNPVVAAAIREIRQLLEQPGNDGTAWVKDWGSRFQPTLGPLRGFLESRPDKFQVLSGEGRKYTVALVSGGGAANDRKRARGGEWVQQAGPAKRQKGSSKGETKEALPEDEAEKEELAELAVAEVRQLLEKQGKKGMVWVKDWPRRFQPKLGTLKDFLEEYPEAFTVIPGEGKKFTVELVEAT